MARSTRAGTAGMVGLGLLNLACAGPTSAPEGAEPALWAGAAEPVARMDPPGEERPTGAALLPGGAVALSTTEVGRNAAVDGGTTTSFSLDGPSLMEGCQSPWHLVWHADTIVARCATGLPAVALAPRLARHALLPQRHPGALGGREAPRVDRTLRLRSRGAGMAPAVTLRRPVPCTAPARDLRGLVSVCASGFTPRLAAG